jgi:hypothetical protein
MSSTTTREALWAAPSNPSGCIWRLRDSTLVVIAWQDRKTLSVNVAAKDGSYPYVRKGFRSLRTAMDYAESVASQYPTPTPLED